MKSNTKPQKGECERLKKERCEKLKSFLAANPLISIGGITTLAGISHATLHVAVKNGMITSSLWAKIAPILARYGLETTKNVI